VEDLPDERTVAVLAADLIFASRIRAAAEAAGVTARLARTAAEVEVAAGEAGLVLLDLDARGLDAPALIRALKANAALAAVPVVAFVSHVRADAIEAARAAGADRVLARSAFVRVLPELLAGIRGGG
jgi:CheY-like chemotaxis protein